MFINIIVLSVQCLLRGRAFAAILLCGHPVLIFGKGFMVFLQVSEIYLFLLGGTVVQW